MCFYGDEEDLERLKAYNIQRAASNAERASDGDEKVTVTTKTGRRAGAKRDNGPPLVNGNNINYTNQ